MKKTTVAGFLMIAAAVVIAAPGDSKKNYGGVEVSGMISGKIYQPPGKIIIYGATFVNNGNSTKSNIKIPDGINKEVLVVNSQIKSDGLRLAKNSENSAMIDINNQNGSSKILIRDVRVTSKDTSLTSVSQKSEPVCAALICTSLRERDSISIMTDILGENKFNATSN